MAKRVKKKIRKDLPKVDRRTRYQPEFSRMAEEYIARNGWDAVGLARLFGVSEDAIGQWLANRSDFKAAVESGKLRYAAERPDAEKIRLAEESLFKRVMGHPFVEKKVTVDEKGETETITTGQIAPDVSAIKYFLKNRCSERWTDRQEVNLTTDKEPPLLVLVMDKRGKKIECDTSSQSLNVEAEELE